MRKTLLAAAGFLGLLWGTATLAQQPAATLEVSATRLEGQRIVASVAVLDAASNPVVGASSQNFTAQIDGTAARIALVDPGVDAALPLGIVLTVDTSGSMAGDAIASARSALSSAVGALRPGDQAALVTFAQTVTTLAPPAEDHAALQAAIDGIQATGNTALFAGVTAAAGASEQQTQPRKAVVLLSDGEDFGNASGGVTRAQALAAARAAGAPFFVVGLGNQIDQQFLTELAQVTGGQYFAAAVPAELAQLYARISERLRQQYTVAVELPDGLAAGTHQVIFAYGSVTARASFTTTAEPAVVQARFASFPAEIGEESVLSLVDVPAGATAQFSINGQPARAEANGRSIRIDPYLFAPGSPQALTVTFIPADAAPAVSTTFRVAALPPKLVAPKVLPNLRPGDLLRLTVQAQPGSTSATYLVDGVEVEHDSEPPFEFVLPDEDYSSSEHELAVVLASPGGEERVAYVFPGLEGGSTNVAAYLLLALLALAVLAALWFGLRRLRTRLANREPALPAEGPPPDLAEWVQSPRAAIAPRAAPAPLSIPTGASAWGRLRITEGPDTGRTFELSAETELVGRGKFCTVRLGDSTLKDAHFIITSGRQLVPSAPANEVFVDGEAVRTTQLGPKAKVRAGATTMDFEGLG